MKGALEKAGKMKFIENYDLKLPPWDHISQTGDLPALKGKMPKWNDEGTQEHSLTVEFDCCCDPKKDPKVTGVP